MNFKHTVFITSFIMSLVISQSTILFGMNVDGKQEAQPGVQAIKIDLPFLVALANSVKPQPDGIDDCRDGDRDKAKTLFYGQLHQTNAKHIYADFVKTLDACISLIEKDLDDEKLWLGKKRDKTSQDTFSPYVQKIDFADGSKIYQWGDLHGGFHSFINELAFLHAQGIIDNNFRILNPNIYFEFLGDFVDRGCFGVEVLYTLMRLKLANPKQVLLIRGNHEDVELNKLLGFNYGFGAELEAKLRDRAILKKINQLYNLLPVAQFVNRQILCCHGGIDLSYVNTDLLKCSEPCKCELLSDQNYNPTVLMARLSDQARKNIAHGFLACALEVLLTSMKSTACTLLESYKSLFQEMSGCIGRNLPSPDNKAYVSVRGSYEKLCGEFDNDKMKEAKLLETLTVNDVLVQNIQGLDTHIKSIKEKTHILLKTFKDLVEVQKTVELPALQAIHQSSVQTLEAMQSDICSEQLQTIKGNVPTLESVKSGLFSQQLQSMPTLEESVLFSQQLGTMKAKAAKLQTSSSDLEKFEKRLKEYENDEKGPGAKDLKYFRDFGAQCSEICALEKDQKLTNFILELFKMQKREEFADLAQRCGIQYKKLRMLFSRDNGVCSIFFLNNIAAKPKLLKIIGFAWSDFCVDTKGPDYSVNSGRSVFGMLLAQEILKAQGIRVVMRAHQHYDPMYSLIIQSKGIACLWDFNNNCEEFNLNKDGLICTMQLAHSSDMDNDVTYDAFGCLSVNGPDITKWTMKKINVSHKYGTIALKKQSSDS